MRKKDSGWLPLVFILLLAALSACQDKETAFAPTDPLKKVGWPDTPVVDVDGNAYETVRLGDQIWMAENLRVTRDPDGKTVESSIYRDSPEEYGRYGRLYTWETAMNGSVEEGAPGICPAGWHLPSDGDWQQLVDFLGGNEEAGRKLLPGQESGFEALPAGGADYRGRYLYFGEEAMYWSSSQTGVERANHWGTNDQGRLNVFAARKGARISVRCVRDDPASGDWRMLSGGWRKADELRSTVEHVMQRFDVPAVSLAVVQGDRIVFEETKGVVDPAGGKAVDDSTVLRAASLSKPVFAYLVMRLVDQGILDLDTPLYEYLEKPLPQYPLYEDLKGDQRYRELTARMLLSHQGGFINWRHTRRDGRLVFKSAPGRQFGYSGEGYRLLQFVLEEVTGRSLNELASAEVFGPLRMENSSFLWESRFDGNFAVELGGGIGRLIRSTRRQGNAAASLLTNASDYAKFLLAVMQQQGLETETWVAMVDPAIRITSRSLFSPPGTDEGRYQEIEMAWTLGWGTFQSPHGKALFHVGREEGCENYAAAFLEQKTAIVILSRTSHSQTFTAPLLEQAIGDRWSPLVWLEYSR